MCVWLSKLTQIDLETRQCMTPQHTVTTHRLLKHSQTGEVYCVYVCGSVMFTWASDVCPRWPSKQPPALFITCPLICVNTAMSVLSQAQMLLGTHTTRNVLTHISWLNWKWVQKFDLSLDEGLVYISSVCIESIGSLHECPVLLLLIGQFTFWPASSLTLTLCPIQWSTCPDDVTCLIYWVSPIERKLVS